MKSTLTTWKKYKSSSTFSRRVTRNVRQIVNSTPRLSLLSVSQKHNEEGDRIRQSLGDDIQYDNNNISEMVSPACYQEPITVTQNSEEENNREQWLVELEDENEEETLTAEQREFNKNEQFRKNLQMWAINFNINHRALKIMMNICNERWPNILPRDPRTLLSTPSVIVIQKIADGFYWHHGLERCLKSSSMIRNLTSVAININIDGLPLHKSSKDEFWPILFNIHELPFIQPMVIGIYFGKGKPSDLQAFITPFVEEAKVILEKGIWFDSEHNLKVSIRCFICDSPARAFIKGVANFNGQHGCLKCTTVGEYSYISHCNIFPDINCHPRTDQGFRSKIYGPHHKCNTPLEQLPGIDMIKDFPVGDALHLIDLGIMKRCLIGWRDGTFRNYRMKWSASDTLNISKFLQNCKMPSEIHRAVRGLDCLYHWKGLEFRTFLYYIGIVILKDHLPADVYQHFLVFFCAVTICSSNLYSNYIDLAEKMLEHYVVNYKEIYGEQYMTSNVHNISHLTDDVRRYGPLSSFSSYPFENKLYQMKNMLRHGGNALAQVAKRIMESSVVQDERDINNDTVFPILQKPNDGMEVDYKSLFNGNTKPNFFYKINFKHYTLSNEMKNKWFLTKRNEIVGLKNIIVLNSNIYIYGACLKYKNDYFEIPIKSSYLNIFASNLTENRPQLYTIDDIKCKLVAVIYNTETVIFIPLLHTL